jgi:hypothetical protein
MPRVDAELRAWPPAKLIRLAQDLDRMARNARAANDPLACELRTHAFYIRQHARTRDE